MLERVMDTKSHIVRHCLNSNQETFNIENSKILNMGYINNTYKKRISEALFVKQYRPYLSTLLMSKTTLFLCSFLIDFNCVSIATLEMISIFQLLEFYCMNKEFSYSDDSHWKVKAKYIVKEK